MASDANIFASLLQQPRSYTDYAADLDKRDMTQLQLENARGQNALLGLTRQQQAMQAQQAIDKQNALRQVLGAYGPNADPAQVEAAMISHPLLSDIGFARQKERLTNAKTQAEAAKDQATAGQTTQSTQIAGRRDAYAEAAALNTPEDAVASVSAAVKAGKLPMQAAQGVIRMVQTDPLWKLKLMQGALDPDKLKEALMPHFTAAGGAMVNTNPLAGPVGQGQPNAIPITQSADNAATQETTRRGQNMTAGTAAEGHRVQLLTHGLDAKGNPTADLEELARGIAEYRIKPPSGFALNNPRMAQVLTRAQQINPDFDATTYDGRQKAARDFSTGKQGQTAQSLNVAIEHLSTLQDAADALGNGNVQAFNKLGNFIATQTGKPAPGNFEATKKIVADEVVKAVVGSGGGVSDREEAARVIQSASSPQQLKGVIDQYTSLLAGQLHGLRQTYERTTGRKDFEQTFLTEPTRAKLGSKQAGKSDVRSAADAILSGGK